MSTVDPEIALSAARLWIAAGSAALLVVVCVLAFARPLTGTWSAVARTGTVVAGGLLGAAMAWAFVDSVPVRNSDADRRALELRSEELATRALSPGSSLACLDALAGDSVEAACEKALFSSPSNVASAVSYAAARLALLADMAAYVSRGGADIDGAMLALQRALEADRFGFVAHALAVREGCTNLDCKALALLRNQNQIRANLNAETFDRYVDRYQTAWAQAAVAPVAEAPLPPQPMTPAQAAALGPRKVLVNIDFPTAASIPPISIMNPEPGVKGPPSVAAAAASGAQAKAAAAPQRARKQAATPAEPAPQDPVYLPAMPAPPAAAQAATPSAPPEASAGTAARTQ